MKDLHSMWAMQGCISFNKLLGDLNSLWAKVVVEFKLSLKGPQGKIEKVNGDIPGANILN